MSVRRLLPMILINILVSALVVLAILFWWDGRLADEETVVEATAVSVTATAIGATADAFVAQQTDTPEPTIAGPTVHIVSAGETLGSISSFYDVALDDIMTANGLTNPNLIAVGQELVIPIGGLAEPTAVPPTATPETADSTPTPIPTIPAATGEAIVEIRAIQGAGDLTTEAIEIVNNGSRQVGLQGWKLSDESGSVYTFGQVTIFEGGAGVKLHTTSGQDGAVDLYWGLAEAIWASGEQATLVDTDGTIQATFVVP